MNKLSSIHTNTKTTSKKLYALANAMRLQILLILLEEDFCVCELQEILGLEQSRLSHQLRILRNLELVDTKQEGRWVVYTVPGEIKEDKLIQAIKKSVKFHPQLEEKITSVKKTNIRKLKSEAAKEERR